jgi:hypothetical protein
VTKDNPFTMHEDFFKELLQYCMSKIIFIILAFSITLTVILLTFGIIWFEQFGSDLKRFFINKMVSSICWSVIALLILVQILQIIFYLYLPFPELFCMLYIVYMNAIQIQLILFSNAIIIFRYMSIFWLRNPMSFKDDFWCFFVNTWVVFYR